MSSKRVGGKPFVAGTNNNPLPKGKNESEDSNPKVDQLSHGVADISLDSTQTGGSDWEVYIKNSKYRAGNSAARAPQSSNTKAWGHPDVVQKLGLRSNGGSGKAPGDTWPTQNFDPKKAAGRGYSWPQSSNRGSENNNVAPQSVIHSPLQHGWNQLARAGSILLKGSDIGQGKDDSYSHYDDVEVDVDNDVDDKDDISDAMDDTDDTDDDLLSDEFDSDSSEKSHETRKRSKWFKKFFDTLDSLSVEEINAPARQWHCPACLGGPGAIDWYRGLLPLMTHAKTKGSKRVRMHRELAELLDEELHRRGTSIIPSGEVFGKWEGLKDGEKDHEIVWPPMVIIMNTRLEQDESDKWIGMGNQELLDYFSSYAAEKARHAYGPQGHRGMSVLIFESSARGYIEAERLHKHFYEQGTDRSAWECCRILFHPGGKRQLYGYIAVKEDLDIFNLHSQGKSNKLKFQMRSYQEMVTNQIRQMSEDNQQLIYLKKRVVKEQKHSKALQDSFDCLSKKLRKTLAENRIVRQRTKLQHEQNKEEMDFQEQFFKNQIKIVRDSIDAKEENFENLQQQERKKVKQSNGNSSNKEENGRSEEKIAKFIQSQDKDMEEFVTEKEKLIKVHEDKMGVMKLRHWEEELKLEKEFDAELTWLMEKYTPQRLEDAGSSI